MGDLLAEKSLTADLWRTIGKCIALFHRKGFYHYDLNIENILIDSEGSVFLLDFDKTYTAGVSKTIAEKNINRLKRSINKQLSISGDQFPKKEWQILIQEHTKELS
jgi:3-deoxy-D-manno-octulosonic acid kinase